MDHEIGILSGANLWTCHAQRTRRGKNGRRDGAEKKRNTHTRGRRKLEALGPRAPRPTGGRPETSLEPAAAKSATQPATPRERCAGTAAQPVGFKDAEWGCGP